MTFAVAIKLHSILIARHSLHPIMYDDDAIVRAQAKNKLFFPVFPHFETKLCTDVDKTIVIKQNNEKAYCVLFWYPQGSDESIQEVLRNTSRRLWFLPASSVLSSLNSLTEQSTMKLLYSLIIKFPKSYARHDCILESSIKQCALRHAHANLETCYERNNGKNNPYSTSFEHSKNKFANKCLQQTSGMKIHSNLSWKAFYNRNKRLVLLSRC